jgi:hypothetical protein
LAAEKSRSLSADVDGAEWYFLTSGNSKEYFAALTGLLQKVCESASQIGEFK